MSYKLENIDSFIFLPTTNLLYEINSYIINHWLYNYFDA